MCVDMSLWSLIVLVVYGSSVESLTCYVCAGHKPSDPCQSDYPGLLEAYDTRSGAYTKNCNRSTVSREASAGEPTEHSNNYTITGNTQYCMIETFSTGTAGQQSFIRGCTDGSTFSVSGITRFEGLVANNKSTCAYYNGQQVCVTLCKTDMCNGPSNAKQLCASAALLTAAAIFTRWLR